MRLMTATTVMDQDSARSRFATVRNRGRRLFMQSVGAASLGLVASSAVNADDEEQEKDDDNDGGEESDDDEPTEIDSCTVIDEPGEYELVADVAPETVDQSGCIVIDSDDVTFRGNGHTIDLSETSFEETGNVFRRNGRTLRNARACLVVNPGIGDEFSWDITVENVEVRGGSSGIDHYLNTGGDFTDITAAENDVGFRFTADGTLTNCIAEDNNTGVFVGTVQPVFPGMGIDIDGCTIRSNSGDGIMVSHESRASVTDSRIVQNGIGVRTSYFMAGATIEDSHICHNEHYGVNLGKSLGYDDPEEPEPPREGSGLATNCYWGAANGPSSFGSPEEPFTDPETGRPADGDGDAVSQSLEPGVSNVRFDPFHESPIDGVGADR